MEYKILFLFLPLSLPITYFFIKYIGCLIFKKEYSNLDSAKNDIIYELKRIEFKNETIDVFEISTSKNIIVLSKNYDNI